MDNNDVRFQLLKLDLEESAKEPATFEEIIDARKMATPAEVLRARQQNTRPQTPDFLNAMEVVSRQKAHSTFLTPTAPGVVFNAGTGEPLSKAAEPEHTGDNLMHLLETERVPDLDSVLGQLEDATAVGRNLFRIAPSRSAHRESEPLRPGPGLHLRDDSTLGEVLGTIGARMPSATGRAFVDRLAAVAAEMGGGA